MKKRTGMILAAAIAAAVLMTAAAPGGSDDPLVSKSYVDEKFDQVLTVLAVLNDSEPIIPQPAETGVPYEPTGVQYEPVSVARGSVLLGGEGTEIILRSGRAVGYCPGENGMVDITSGADVFNGAEILPNHMLIVPRDDGRGATVIADAWFLVKGTYSIR